MELYIMSAEKIQIIQRRTVFLGDVASVFVSGQKKDEVEKLIVFQIPFEQKKTYLLSIMDLIQAVKEKYPDALIYSLGEKDILLEYLPQQEKQSVTLTFLKAAFVSAVLFVGAATTIMCFHTDVQLPLIFQNIYYIFYGENREMPAILSIPYSIGLGLGIIIFFNHFSKASLTEDPTPIEIEMTTYEKETNASIIDFLGRRKGGGEG
ncbi:MAG: stage V sporulation protein AA [Anaerotignum sp.]|nr:stage V sporulation protein AA [Anaerotignum sp.]